jgi:hypothetical protein
MLLVTVHSKSKIPVACAQLQEDIKKQERELTSFLSYYCLYRPFRVRAE